MAGGKQVIKLDCSLCLSAFRDPKLLPCFHTFCLQCLDEYVLRNGKGGKFDCPLCRVCIDIPVGGVKSFQSNFYIHGGYISEQDIDCEVCGEGHKGTHYCTDCEQNFCERCTTSHMKIRMTREHTLIQLKDMVENDKKCTRKIHRKYFCSRHKDEEIKMVCKDCDTKLCVVCKLTEHENHNTSSLADEAEERRESLLQTIAIANSKLEKFKTSECKANNKAVDIEKELTQNIALLESRVDSHIASVKVHTENIKQELTNRNTKATQYYLDKGKQIRDKIIESEAIINHAENVVDTGDDCQVLDMNLISNLKSLIASENCSIQWQDYYEFEASSFEFAVDVLGKIAKVCPKMTVTELNQIGMEIKDLDEIPIDANELKELFSSLEMTVAEIGDLFCSSVNANALSMDSTQLYAAFTDYDRFLCHEISTSTSSNTDKLYIKGMCGGLTNINKDLYFTSLDDKTIYILKTQEHTKKKFHSLKDYPHGVVHRTCTGSDSEQELLLCCLKSDKVLGKDKCEGSVIAIPLRNKQEYTWRDKEIPGPACIAVDKHTGNVCLGYPAGHKVTINAADGTVLAVYSGLGCHGNTDIFCPVSVCFDGQFGIIIADNENGSVIKIDKSCHFLQCLVQMNNPLSVITGDGNMLFVGFEGKEITKYEFMPII